MKVRYEFDIDTNICHPDEFIARLRLAMIDVPPECRDKMELEFIGIHEPWDDEVFVDCTLLYARDETIAEEKMRVHLAMVDERLKAKNEIALLKRLMEKYPEHTEGSDD